MGNWNISIRGVGCHHNQNLSTDADRMARRFVRELKEGAEITHGGVTVYVPDQLGQEISPGLEDGPCPETCPGRSCVLARGHLGGHQTTA